MSIFLDYEIKKQKREETDGESCKDLLLECLGKAKVVQMINELMI